MSNVRTLYFTMFALRNLSAFRPHRFDGETFGKGKEVWRNVAKHCLVAGAFADLIATLMRVSPMQVRNVTHGAILHDWNKKREALACRRASNVAELRSVLVVKKTEHEQTLRQLGYADEIVRLTGANTPQDARGPQSDEEKIVWYVDAMLTGDQPVRIDSRFDSLENDPIRGEANRAFSKSNELDYGNPLYDVQRALGKSVGREIAERIGYSGPTDDLPVHQCRLLEDRFHTMRGSEKRPET